MRKFFQQGEQAAAIGMSKGFLPRHCIEQVDMHAQHQ